MSEIDDLSTSDGARSDGKSTTVSSRLRLAVVDQRRLVREGLAAAIEAEGEHSLVGVFSSLDQVDEKATADVVLLGESPRVESWAPGPRWMCFGGLGLAEILAALRTDEGIASLAPETVGAGSDAPPIRSLTGRESDVLSGMAAGNSNAAIARDLGIAGKTVETYKQRIFTKLGVQSAPEAVALMTSSRAWRSQ